MTITTSRAVSEQPVATLRHWRMLVTDSDEVLLVGFCLETKLGRVSTPIVALLPNRVSAISSSGRTYVLEGPPDFTGIAEVIWGYWAQRFGVMAVDDLSRALYAEFIDRAAKPH